MTIPTKLLTNPLEFNDKVVRQIQFVAKNVANEKDIVQKINHYSKYESHNRPQYSFEKSAKQKPMQGKEEKDEVKNGENNNGGRPSKYDQSFNLVAFKLCLLGFIDKDLASFFEVDVSTIHQWKKDHQSFADSLRQGKSMADANVSEKLYQRAIGYSHPDVDIRVIKGKIKKTKIIKHYAPDVVAAIFWLKNRQKEIWRDKQVIDFGYENLTDEQLDKLIQAHISESKKNKR